jgi:outer membrane receptor for ferrienterochelin and colicins
VNIKGKSIMRPVYAVTLLGLAFSVQAQQQGNVKQMETVVVTASGFEQVVRDAPASITVITREELEKNRSKTLGKPLRTLKAFLSSVAAKRVE